MPKMLADEGVEYEDGVPATESQQAKVGCGQLIAASVLQEWCCLNGHCPL